MWDGSTVETIENPQSQHGLRTDQLDERVALMRLLQKLTNFHGLRGVPVD